MRTGKCSVNIYIYIYIYTWYLVISILNLRCYIHKPMSFCILSVHSPIVSTGRCALVFWLKKFRQIVSIRLTKYCMIFVGFFYALTVGAPWARATRVLHTQTIRFSNFLFNRTISFKFQRCCQMARDAPPIHYFIKKHRHRHLQAPILINNILFHSQSKCLTQSS